MAWIERIDILLDIAAHVPWRWFVAGAICGVLLSAVVVEMAVVVVGTGGEMEQMNRSQINVIAALICINMGLVLGWLVVIAAQILPAG